VPTYVWVNTIFDVEIICVSSGGKGMRKFIFFLLLNAAFQGVLIAVDGVPAE